MFTFPKVHQVTFGIAVQMTYDKKLAFVFYFNPKEIKT